MCNSVSDEQIYISMINDVWVCGRNDGGIFGKIESSEATAPISLVSLLTDLELKVSGTFTRYWY